MLIAAVPASLPTVVAVTPCQIISILVLILDPDPDDEGSMGRFDIDLYKCDNAFCGQQDCGTFVEEICDKPG